MYVHVCCICRCMLNTSFDAEIAMNDNTDLPHSATLLSAGQRNRASQIKLVNNRVASLLTTSFAVHLVFVFVFYFTFDDVLYLATMFICLRLLFCGQLDRARP